MRNDWNVTITEVVVTGDYASKFYAPFNASESIFTCWLVISDCSTATQPTKRSSGSAPKICRSPPLLPPTRNSLTGSRTGNGRRNISWSGSTTIRVFLEGPTSLWRAASTAPVSLISFGTRTTWPSEPMLRFELLWFTICPLTDPNLRLALNFKLSPKVSLKKLWVGQSEP